MRKFHSFIIWLTTFKKESDAKVKPWTRDEIDALSMALVVLFAALIISGIALSFVLHP